MTCLLVLSRAVQAAIIPGRTRLVMLESPTNPRMQICDITSIAKMAHEVRNVFGLTLLMLSQLISSAKSCVLVASGKTRYLIVICLS